MNASLKLGLYVVAVLGTLICGINFARGWRQVNAQAAAAPNVTLVSEKPPEPAAKDGGTAAASAVDAAAAGDGVTNAPAAAAGSEAVAGAATVAPAATNTNEVAAADREPAVDVARPVVSGRGWSRLLFWGFLGLISIGGLGALIAYDVTQYAGSRATQTLFDDEGEGIPESIDDQVEKAKGDGDFLEAIRLLRDHLGRNPKEVEVQIRIAEIYEKDLNNPLAAALEYEEVLKLPMRPEKRGWTSIHLVNLYNRLEKPDQAIACLQRVVVECPGTPAAAKAQERLEAAGLEVPHPPEPESPTREEEPPSNLPPGFRPKGR